MLVISNEKIMQCNIINLPIKGTKKFNISNDADGVLVTEYNNSTKSPSIQVVTNW